MSHAFFRSSEENPKMDYNKKHSRKHSRREDEADYEDEEETEMDEEGEEQQKMGWMMIVMRLRL